MQAQPPLSPARRMAAGLAAASAVILAAAVLPAAGRAEPFLARYDVAAAGLTVMRVEAVFDLDAPGGTYRVSTRIRPTGMAGFFATGDQVTSVEGRWQGSNPLPVRYRVEGTWRGGRRQVAMDYGPGGMPVVHALVPPNDADREAVPPEMQRGTMDSLSALAKLTRAVARTGRCDADAATFDGRRRADYVVRTAGLDTLPAEGAFAGQALRCAFESRLIAGRRADQDPEEARRPQPATAWMAQVPGASTPVPVRIDLPSRWFGTIRVGLVAIEPAPAGASPAAATAPSGRRDQIVQQGR